MIDAKTHISCASDSCTIIIKSQHIYICINFLLFLIYILDGNYHHFFRHKLHIRIHMSSNSNMNISLGLARVSFFSSSHYLFFLHALFHFKSQMVHVSCIHACRRKIMHPYEFFFSHFSSSGTSKSIRLLPLSPNL